MNLDHAFQQGVETAKEGTFAESRFQILIRTAKAEDAWECKVCKESKVQIAKVDCTGNHPQ